MIQCGENYCPETSLCKHSNESLFGDCYSNCELPKACPRKYECVHEYPEEAFECHELVLAFLLYPAAAAAAVVYSLTQCSSCEC